MPPLLSMAPVSPPLPDPVPVAFSEIVLMAVDSLKSNTLRTGLTMLGVVIGIASVITVTSVGQGVQASTENQLQGLGSNVLTIRAGSARNGGIALGVGSVSTLTWDDARALASQPPSVAATAAFLQTPVQLVYRGTNVQTTAVGTEASFPDIRDFRPTSGRFFSDSEVSGSARVVVLGSAVQKKLADDGTLIGQTLRLQGQQFTIIGILETKGASGPTNEDDQVFIPLSTASQRLVGTQALSGISISGLWAQATHPDEIEAAQFQMTNLLRLRHNIYPPDEDDFNVFSQTDLINTISGVLGTLTLMVGAVGSISLWVGGIGIANIMLVSVVERTREIGIRKALGATRGSVLSQFLVESVVIALIGGGAGIGLGVILSTGAALAMGYPLVISTQAVVTGFGLSACVGLLAGAIPARRAAHLDPITALRSE